MEEKVRAFGDEVYVGCHRKKKKNRRGLNDRI